MKLDTTDAQASDNSGFIYRDGPGLLGLNRGSSLGNNVNASTINYVAYCWHDVPGTYRNLAVLKEMNLMMDLS